MGFLLLAMLTFFVMLSYESTSPVIAGAELTSLHSLAPNVARSFRSVRSAIKIFILFIFFALELLFSQTQRNGVTTVVCVCVLARPPQF